MAKQVCETCKQEQSTRAMKYCTNCGKPMCSDCYNALEGRCDCTTITSNQSIDFI